MRHADEALARSRSDDPDAIGATDATRRARDVLARWLGFTDALLACTALLDGGTWDTAALTATADALAAIGREPAWSTMLWESFDGWQRWCDRMGEQRALAADAAADRLRPGGDDAAMRVAAIDAAFASLAATLRAEHAANPASDPTTLLAHMEPYAAALLVQHLGLGHDELARRAFQLVSAWCDRTPGIARAPVSGAPFDLALRGENAADLLFRSILATPGAATAFVSLAATRPETLFAAGDDPALARAVLLAGTSPEHGASEAAGASITSILDWFRRGDVGAWTADRLHRRGDGHDWRPVLAEMVAPWLLHLSPLDRAWPGDAASRRDAVAYVLGDPAALQAMLAAADDAAAGLRAELATRSAPGHGGLSLDELAAFAGMLSQLAIDERVHDAETQTATWDLWWKLVGIGLNAVDDPIANAGLKVAADGTRRFAVEHQLLGAPTPPDTVRDRAGYEREWVLTTMGAGLVDATFRQLVANGRLPPDAAPPPVPDARSDVPQLTYEQAYRDWKEEVFDGPDDPRASEVDAVKSPFLNAADAGRTLAED